MSMMRRRNMMGGEVDDKTLFQQYVNPGFWIDAIQNTANGHNGTATRWFNHRSADPKKEFGVNSNTIIGDNYYIPNGRMNYYEVGTTTSKNVSQMTDSYSIEIVFAPIPSNESAQMITANRGNAYGTCWVNGAGTRIYFSTGNNGGCVGIETSEGVHTYTATGKGKTYYKDGQAVTPITSDGTWSYSYRSYLFYYSSSYPRPFVSKICAMRWYTRELTADEVRKNYELDRIRFGSGVS